MKKIITLIIVLCTLSGIASAATVFDGRVVEVSDGDTIVVESASGKIRKIRLYGADTPEGLWPGHWPKQPFSAEAKNYVKSKVLGRNVRVVLNGDRTYSRDVGKVFIKGSSLAKDIISKGLAWWNSKYAANELHLKRAEEKARKARIGLWKDRNPTPPWEWRRRHRS